MRDRDRRRIEVRKVAADQLRIGDDVGADERKIEAARGRRPYGLDGVS